MHRVVDVARTKDVPQRMDRPEADPPQQKRARRDSVVKSGSGVHETLLRINRSGRDWRV